MSDQTTRVLTLQAATALDANRFVGYDGKAKTNNTTAAAGVTNADAGQGDWIAVQTHGVAWLTAADSFSVGDAVMASSGGHASKHSTGIIQGYVAGAHLGSVVPVRLLAV
ncbi:MAG: DUF2190 family protein [Alphaproteobacteria bacterium]|nr:DUF2190 family protein [Alphaproteobacteria bacterium]